MSNVYIPPFTAQEKATAWAEMMARDYRCKVSVTLDDEHGVLFNFECNHGRIEAQPLPPNTAAPEEE